MRHGSLLTTLSLAFAFACASASAVADTTPPPPRPAPVEETKVALQTEKLLAFFDKLADVVVANKNDCAKMAASINALVDANASILAWAHDAKASGRALSKDAEAHLVASMQRMTASLMKCQSDKAVQTAFERMK